jgi:hypothetical protein
MTTTARPTTPDHRFDRIIDAITDQADPDSIEGTFSYHVPTRPSGHFTVLLAGVEYRVSIAPVTLR